MASFFWTSIARISFSTAESCVMSVRACATSNVGSVVTRLDTRIRRRRRFACRPRWLTTASSAGCLLWLVDQGLVLRYQVPLTVGLDVCQRECSRNLVDLAVKLNHRIRPAVENHGIAVHVKCVPTLIE